MNRITFAVLLVCSGAGAVAAPVPKEDAAAWTRRVYGVTHDPDRGAEFRNAGDTLHIRVPLETRLFEPLKSVVNAPRVWREVRGNFTATVRVSFPIRAPVPAKHEDAIESRAGGGLIVWCDDKRFLTLSRNECQRDGKPGEYYRSEFRRKDGVGGSSNHPAPQKSGHLRVERREKGLNCSYSLDGKKWVPLSSYAIDWGEDVKVGVFAENGYKAPFEAAFDGYSVTKP